MRADEGEERARVARIDGEAADGAENETVVAEEEQRAEPEQHTGPERHGGDPDVVREDLGGELCLLVDREAEIVALDPRLGDRLELRRRDATRGDRITPRPVSREQHRDEQPRGRSEQQSGTFSYPAPVSVPHPVEQRGGCGTPRVHERTSATDEHLEASDDRRLWEAAARGREIGDSAAVCEPEAHDPGRAELLRPTASLIAEVAQLVPCPAPLASEVVYVHRVPIDDHIAITTPEGVRLELAVVGVGSRFVARLLDTLIQVGLIIALAIVAAALSGESGFVTAIIWVLSTAVLFAYDIVLELAMGGQTPGKRAAGIRVVDRQGRPVGFLASAVRNILRLVDFLPFFYGAGLVAMVATKHSQRLGDVAAGTLVVRERNTAEIEYRARAGHATPSVPLADVAHWDVGDISATDIVTIRHFLDRRVSLPPAIRGKLAAEMATALTTKVVGIPSDLHPEYVLEGIVVAKERR